MAKKLNPEMTFVKGLNEIPSTTVNSAGNFLINDGGTLKQSPMTQLQAMVQGEIKILLPSDAAPTVVGKYGLRVGTYTNLVPIIPIGSDTPTSTPITTEDGFYNAVYWDGTNFTQIKTTIANFSELRDWDNEDGVVFPATRVYDDNIYRVKAGETVTASDIPGESDKWELIGFDYLSESDEFLRTWKDDDGNIILAITKDGDIVNKSFNNLKVDVKKRLTNIEPIVNELSNILFQNIDDEYVYTVTDRMGNIILAINSDGDVIFKDSNKYKSIEPAVKEISDILFSTADEEYISMLTDRMGNIISGRKNDGVLSENKIETNNLIIKERLEFKAGSINSLIQSLKDANFSPSAGKSNKSDDAAVYLPFPTTLAYINFDVLPSQLPVAKPTVVDVTFEYWDAEGNYLKKPGSIAVQGSSSEGHLRKNFTLDIEDGSTMKFGAMLESDSYYLKSFYTDSFRGQSIAMYKLYMDIINSRTIPNRKAFYAGYTAPSLATGTGKLLYDMSSGATYVANGFPIALYCKGEFYGIYCIVQKKNRANYDMKKANANEIWIDGVIDWKFFQNNIIWTDFELRNPTVKNMDGSDYNGDNPQEIQASATKTYIQNFATRIISINSQATDALKKTEFLKYFDLNSVMDYFIFSNIIYNFDGFAKNWQWYTKDGVKWAIGLHDLDNIFGMSWRGEFVLIDDLPTSLLGADGWMPTSFMTNIFLTETKARYAELKALKLITADAVTDRVKLWLDSITAPMLNADLAKWPETPSYRDSKTNKNYWVAVKMSPDNMTGFNTWNSATSYAVGDKVKLVLTDDTYGFRCIQANTNQNPITGSYANYPANLGFYNSLDRVRQSVAARVALLDTTLI